MDCSTPGFPVHHQFLELAQTLVHRVSDAILPVPAGKVDQVSRSCTVGLRKETKAREIYNKDGVERFRHVSTKGRSLTPTLFSISYLYRRV